MRHGLQALIACVTVAVPPAVQPAPPEKRPLSELPYTPSLDVASMPLAYRINGVVVNMPEFREAFACKAGAPMVKAEVCRVW